MHPEKRNEQGKHLFLAWCVEEGLEARSVSDGAMEAEFIVEVDPATKKSGGISSRMSSRCRIWVDVVSGKAGVLTLALPKVDALAKEFMPAFVLVFKLDDDTSPMEAYLLHLMGSRLETVLKQLRAEADAQGGVHPPTVSFKLTASERLPSLSAHALHRGLIDAIGGSVRRYMSSKREVLARYGHLEEPYVVQFDVEGIRSESLLAIFKGLPSDVKLKTFSLVDERFRREALAEKKSKSGHFQNWLARDTATVTFRSDEDFGALTFDGDASLLTGSTGSRLHIKNKFFAIVIDDEEADCFYLTSDPSSITATPTEWLTYWRALRCLEGPHPVIECRVTARPSPLCLHLAKRPLRLFPKMDGIVSVIEHLCDIGKHAGNVLTTSCSMTEIAEAERRIEMLFHFIEEKVGNLPIRRGYPAGHSRGSAEDVLFVSVLRLGKLRLAYCLRASPSSAPREKAFEAVLESPKIKRLAFVRTLSDLHRFIDQVRISEEVSVVLAETDFSKSFS